MIESAIPFDILEQIKEEKWQKFKEIRLPQIREQIKIKRLHYQEIMNRLEK